ncbi:MAG: hypothetical protein M3305_13745 [Actinomycetota bacterium]|nr:hypothetical protein [Actinomycetota bacterium]
MLREMLLGTVAGALGTVVLNAATYADTVIRARPSSSVPAEVAGTLAEKVGVGSDETEQNRKSGLVALSGYVVGIGVRSAYGIVRPHLGGASKMRAGVVLGLAAMAGSDMPVAALGVTSPAEWDASCWLSAIMPRLACGLTTALAYDFQADV